MPNIYDLAEKHKADLANLDLTASSLILDEYGRAWNSVAGEINAVTAEIERAKAEGREALVPPTMGGKSAKDLGGYSQSLSLHRTRLLAIQKELEQQIAQVAKHADLITQDAQRQAIEAALGHTKSLTGEALAGGPPGFRMAWTTPNLEPLMAQVGFLADGSPLKSLLAELPGDAGRRVSSALVDGITQGLHPTVIARKAREALAGNASRAILIARTEMMRSYREASRQAYQENSDLVRGWVWHAALDSRTCASCWAMHGTEHPVTEILDDHPHGRCAMVPRTHSWEDLGFPGVKETAADDVQPGSVAFDNAPEDVKRRVLGPSKYQAYLDGDADLEDFVVRVDNGDWGTMRREASLVQAKANKAQRLKAASSQNLLKQAQYDQDWEEAHGLNALLDKKAKVKAKSAARRARLKAEKEAMAAVSEVAEPDLPWGTWDRLTRDPGESQGLGGMHPKDVFRDGDGNLWLWKPQDQFRADVDTVTSALMRRVGLDGPDTFTLRNPQGQWGSMQRMYGTKETRRLPFQKNGPFDATKITPDAMEQVQKHHVMDWLMSNHDAHSGNFIRVSGSQNIVAIDKGQAFRFFGKDRLDYDYNPNPEPSIYNLMHRQFVKGEQVDMRLITAPEGKALREFIDQVQGIPDDEFRALLRPMAEHRWAAGQGMPGKSVDQFLDMAVTRKNRLVDDFTGLHRTLADERAAWVKAEKARQAKLLKGKTMDGAVDHTTDAEGVAWARKQWKVADGAALDYDEQRALSYYQGSGYGPINGGLRTTKGKGENGDTMALDRALARKPLAEDVILKRGTDTREFVDNLPGIDVGYGADLSALAGQQVTLHGYTSTSVGGQAAFSTHEVQMRIRAPKGTGAFFMDRNPQASASYRAEREVLLERGLTLTILKAEKVGVRWLVDAIVTGRRK